MYQQVRSLATTTFVKHFITLVKVKYKDILVFLSLNKPLCNDN